MKIPCSTCRSAKSGNNVTEKLVKPLNDLTRAKKKYHNTKPYAPKYKRK